MVPSWKIVCMPTMAIALLFDFVKIFDFICVFEKKLVPLSPKC